MLRATVFAAFCGLLPAVHASTGSSPSATPEDVCNDGNEECPAWSKLGECKKNPDYMLQNCRLSCEQCKPPPAPPAPAPAPPAGGTAGRMSMWDTRSNDIVGASCGFADASIGGLQAETAQTPYIHSGMYCGMNTGLYGAGAQCGACYFISSGNRGAVVQVVNSGGAEAFNCHLNAYQAITGASSGTSDIQYQLVPCNTAGGSAVATIVDGNEFYTKFIFTNLPYPVQKAKLNVAADLVVELSRVADTAQWSGTHKQIEDAVGFSLEPLHGEAQTLAGCFGGQHKLSQLPPGAACRLSAGAVPLANEASVPEARESAYPLRLRGNSSAPAPPPPQ